MGRYLIRRLLTGLFTLWGLGTVLFVLLRYFPGGPFDDEVALRPEIRALLEEKYHIHEAGFQAYLRYWSQVLQGDFGTSLHYAEQSVSRVIASGFQATLALSLSGLIAALVFGLLWGTLPHLSYLWSRPARAFSQLGLSLPTLFLGPLLLWLLCFRFEVFPIRVDGSVFSYVLPVFLIAFRPSMTLGRLLDVRLRHIRREDYIRTLEALGSHPRRLIWRWSLKNALPVYVGSVPGLAAGLLSGSLLVETLFSIQGLGFQFTQSLLNRDWTLALGLTLFFGVLLIGFQIVADAVLMWLDPRVKIQ
ncbi:MAG: ABC transporter permease [Bdellovibrionaceae bacterium]|nr:ABC transporter permease [Pseudobdellovibrionaceae bacterium]